MVTNKLFAPVVLLAALSLTALPAAAGQGRSRESHGDRGKAVAHATQRQAAPRQSARQNESRQGQASRSETRRQQGPSRQAAPQQSARRQGESRQQAPRVEPRREQGPSRQAPPRANERRAGAPQPYRPRQSEAPRYTPPRQTGRAYAVPRRDYDRGRSSSPSYYYRPYYNYRPYYRSVPYRPHYFVRPYFAFRPRLTIGFGLWLGYPVPYPYAYVGGYAPGLYGSVGVVRGVSVYGGLSFDISPYDAAVFVDGQYVGTVADFPPNAPPLTLTPGVYRIEVQAPGYRPMVWDVTIVPGQVIPYRGAMQLYRDGEPCELLAAFEGRASAPALPFSALPTGSESSPKTRGRLAKATLPHERADERPGSGTDSTNHRTREFVEGIEEGVLASPDLRGADHTANAEADERAEQPGVSGDPRLLVLRLPGRLRISRLGCRGTCQAPHLSSGASRKRAGKVRGRRGTGSTLR